MRECWFENIHEEIVEMVTSVLDELRESRFEDILEDIVEMVFRSWVLAGMKLFGTKDKVGHHPYRGDHGD